jgi:dTDP-4-dehydrorhamnose reductase
MNGYRQCELEPARSREVNVTGLNLLHRKCSIASIPVTLISSSAVFSGDCLNRSEDAPVSPTSAYGEQKSDQERIVLSEPSGRVIRLTKVFPDIAGMLVSWAGILRSGRCIDAFSDYYVSPLSYRTVVNFIVEDTVKEEGGVRHLSPDGQLSYYELAKRMCEFLGANGEVRPVLNAVPRHQRAHTLLTNPVLNCDAPLSLQVSMHAEIQKIFRDLVSTPRLEP